MNCTRCGQEIEIDAPLGVVICGSCADDLRAEEDAIAMSTQAEDEAIAEALNKDAYEDTLRRGESDYRFHP